MIKTGFSMRHPSLGVLGFAPTGVIKATFTALNAWPMNLKPFRRGSMNIKNKISSKRRPEIRRVQALAYTLPILFLFAASGLLPEVRTAQAAPEKATRNKHEVIAKVLISQPNISPFGLTANPRLSVPAPPRIYRVTYNDGGGGGGESRNCYGSCPHQTLVCTGGTVDSFNGCCMTCSNSGGSTTVCCQ
jgi:hypothetical protein